MLCIGLDTNGFLRIVLTRQIGILDEEQFDGVVLQCHLEFVSVMHYGGIELREDWVAQTSP
jgi:hypothetical protein